MNQNSALQEIAYEIRRPDPDNQSVSVTIRKAPENSGIRFIIADKGKRGMVCANWRNARVNDGDIDLISDDGISVRKIGYFLAALRVAGIANAVVEMNTDTVDACYSDIAGLLVELEKGGLWNPVPCEKTPLPKCAAVEEGKHCAIALPSDRLIIELYIENKTGDGDCWYHAEFDECRKFSGSAAATGENFGFGIRTKGKGGDRLPPDRVHRQMLSALGLLALYSDHQGIQFRGINFTLDVGLSLLKLLMNDETGDF